MRLSTLTCLLFFSLCTIIAQDEERENSSLFRDEEDGKFDMSNFLLTKAGFLPIPIIITNPALGYGGMLAASFFHESMAESKGYPTVSGIVAGGSSNSSWTAGAYHMQSFFDHKVRYSGFAGYGDFNMRFYGLGYTDYFKNNEHNLYYNSWIMMHRAQGKIGSSDFYVGGQYLMMDNEIAIRPVPNFLQDLLTQSYFVSQLSLVISYDSRNNFFSPTQGIKCEASWNYSDEWLGSTHAYNSLTSYALGHTEFSFLDGLVGGIRFEYDVAFDGTPFFLQPFVNNRGVAMARYQDKQMFEMEAELLYGITPRVDILCFGGMGDAYGTEDNTIFSDDIALSGGVGFRYLIAKKFGIKVGPDFTYADDFSFQIVMGSAWLRN